MSENLSEVFSRTWWIIVVSFLSGLALNILGNFLTEIIKKKLSKYSESLRSKKGQRIEEQKKLVAELFTNHSRLLFYLAMFIVKFIMALFAFGFLLLSGMVAGFFLGAGFTMTALFFFSCTFVIAVVPFSLLRNIIYNELPTLVLLDKQFQMAEKPQH